MVTYVIEEGILTLRLAERYAFEDVIRTLRSALDDQRLRPRTPLLLDIRKSQESRSQQELVALADFIKTAQGLLGERCAVVASDPLRFGLGRELSGWAASRGIQVRVFGGQEAADARQWLRSSEAGAESEQGGEPA
jgi:hypothetical protein